ncbi:hypothetical protein Tco_1260982, partial [Tanacetum coccineum]
DEEYERINKEMYDDVNVELKDAEPSNEEKGDEEMTHAENTTVTAAPATQNTKVPLQSSSILSDYATKFINFDNIPSSDTEIISMMDVKVQHEDPSIPTSPLLTVPVTKYTIELIKEHSILADVIDVLQQQHKPQKSAADIHKIKMEHAAKQQES